MLLILRLQYLAKGSDVNVVIQRTKDIVNIASAVNSYKYTFFS